MKALVLFSGGLDSTTCLAMAINKYGKENVIALSISYGQKHIKEIEASNNIVLHYGVKHITLDLKQIFEGSDCSLLIDSTKDIPTESYEAQLNNYGEVSTYVPFRNGLFLSAASSIALVNGCDEIYYGIHGDDQALNAYPDTSVDFNDAINKAIYLGTGNKVKVIAPFVNLRKSDVVKKGLELNAPLNKSWSCYNGKLKACGKCATCIDRIEAFRKNGVNDEIEYEVNINE